MDAYRFRIVMLLLMLSIGLCGFKKPLRHAKSASSKEQPAEIKAQSKALDLSLPQSGHYFSDFPQKLVEATDASLFTRGQNKVAELELHGQLIATQEQEREKSRSADGAGIMINLRH